MVGNYENILLFSIQKIMTSFFENKDLSFKKIIISQKVGDEFSMDLGKPCSPPATFDRKCIHFIFRKNMLRKKYEKNTNKLSYMVCIV